MAIPWEADKLKEWIIPMRGWLGCRKHPYLFSPVTTDSKEETGNPVTRQHSSIPEDYGKHIFLEHSFFFVEVKFFLVILLG